MKCHKSFNDEWIVPQCLIAGNDWYSVITIESKARAENIWHEMFSPDDKKIAISNFLLLDAVKKQDYWHVKNRKNLKKIIATIGWNFGI